MSVLNSTFYFIRRELRNRYIGSISGGVWGLVQPLLQLAVYSFVFVYIFKNRLPASEGPSFVPFLVVALWPWVAFSDSLLRATTVIQDNAALIGKVALQRELLVVSSVTASFLLHFIGFILICLVLAAVNGSINVLNLPLGCIVFIQLYLFALGLSFVLSALQVFVRDVVQVLGQLMSLWMFMSPIFYSREMLPEVYRGWFDLNPFSYYAETMRALLLRSDSFVLSPYWWLHALIAVFIGLLGYALFRRLNPYFEDFL